MKSAKVFCFTHPETKAPVVQIEAIDEVHLIEKVTNHIAGRREYYRNLGLAVDIQVKFADEPWATYSEDDWE